MIDYLYRLDYDDKPKTANTKSSDGPLVMNANVYSIADKYEIWSLKEAAQRKTSNALHTTWNHESFLLALSIVWTTTLPSDRGLRDLFLPIITKNKEILHEDEAFREMIRNNGDMAVDVLLSVWANFPPNRVDRLYCAHYGCMELRNVQCSDCGWGARLYLQKE